MENTIAGSGASPAHPGLFSRVIGVITSPREAFQWVVARPRWFGVLALTTVAIAVCAALPLTTEAGQQSALDQQVRWTESITGRPVSDADYERLHQRMWIAPYTQGGGALIFAPISTAIVAVILWAVFNAAMGGTATYKQMLAVVVHAGIISTLGALFAAPINYVRGTASSSAANLRVLLPMIDESSFVGRLLGTVDVFLIWWVFVLAIGLAVLYKRRTQPIAITLFAVYAVIALIIAVVGSRFGGGA